MRQAGQARGGGWGRAVWTLRASKREELRERGREGSVRDMSSVSSHRHGARFWVEGECLVSLVGSPVDSSGHSLWKPRRGSLSGRNWTWTHSPRAAASTSPRPTARGP